MVESVAAHGYPRPYMTRGRCAKSCLSSVLFFKLEDKDKDESAPRAPPSGHFTNTMRLLAYTPGEIIAAEVLVNSFLF